MYIINKQCPTVKKESKPRAKEHKEEGKTGLACASLSQNLTSVVNYVLY